LAYNKFGELVLPEGWRSHYSNNGAPYVHTDGRTTYQRPGKPEGVIALADAIRDNWALTKLDMSQNALEGAAAGKAIGDMLTDNVTLKDLNLGMCSIDSDAVQGISTGLAGNGALVSLDLSENHLEADGAKVVAKAIKVTSCAIAIILAPCLCISI
jgi:hypothetical protein